MAEPGSGGSEGRASTAAPTPPVELSSGSAALSARLPAELSSGLPAEFYKYIYYIGLTGVPEGVAAGVSTLAVAVASLGVVDGVAVASLGVVDGVLTITLAIKQDPALVSQFFTHSPVFTCRRNSLFTGT